MLGPGEDIEAADEAWGIDFEAEVAVITGDVPMGADAAEARRPHPACDARQRRQPAQSHSRRARQGIRVSAVEAGLRVLARRGDAGRARRRMARRQAAPAARVARQRRAVRASRRRRRHGVLVCGADRARREDAHARRRQHRRLGHGLEQGARRTRPSGRRRRHRLFVHCRAAHGRDDSRRQGPTRRSCDSAIASASRCSMRAGRTIFGAIDQAVRRSRRSSSAPAHRGRARPGTPFQLR